MPKNAKDKGKAKGNDKKRKKSKSSVISTPDSVVPVVEQPKEVKQEEPKIIIKEKPIEEPCLFSCTNDKVTFRPNSYPGILPNPKTMSVVGSECGSYDSLCKLLHSGFRCADRIYAMVPWGNYVVMRAHDGTKMTYYLFDGCTCNVNRFRYLDLSCGTAGFLYFEEMHKMINYIIMSRSRREEIQNLKRCVVDDVCKEMYGPQHI